VEGTQSKTPVLGHQISDSLFGERQRGQIGRVGSGVLSNKRPRYGWEILSQFDPATIVFLHRFRNLESLFLTHWNSRWFTTEQLFPCFLQFGETVIDLRLEDAEASSESLIYLTSMFPRFRVLQISISTYCNEWTRGMNSKEEFPTSGSFQGRLYLYELSEQHDFFIFLPSTSPEFDTIYIDGYEIGDGMGKLLESSAAALGSELVYTFAGTVWEVGSRASGASICTDFAL